MEKIRLRNRSDERGVAMITAMAAALIISITAIAVLNMTLRRFELSAFRTDRAVAGAEAEAGVRYAFARLQINDTNQLHNASGTPYGPVGVPFQTRVQNDPDGLVVSSNPAAAGLDHLEPNLHLGAKINTERNPDGTPGPNYGNYVGGKHITVVIRYDPAAAPAGRPFVVRARADYGTGN